MSYGAEISVEMMIHQIGAENKEKQRIFSGLWQTKDGTVIRISDMTERHIRNCIAMISRNRDDDNGYLWIEQFEEELEKRAWKHALKGY